VDTRHEGLLQGQHRFFGLGWLQISDGVGRFGIMVLVILVFGGKAAAAMFAAVVGQLITISIGAWLTYSIWSVRPASPFNAKRWMGEALPLTLGLGTVLLMSASICFLCRASSRTRARRRFTLERC